MMRTVLFAVIASGFLSTACSSTSDNQQQYEHYFPPKGEWEEKDPSEIGLDPRKLEEALQFARENETPDPRDLTAYLKGRFTESYDSIVGPTKPRGDMSAMVIKGGYLVAKFGPLERVDMTFSITKSFLSTVAGLAIDDGKIKHAMERMRFYVKDGKFGGPQNSNITWKHLLQQTSEWEGTLFGKPDIADRRKGKDRKLQEPGTFWEYNDVRVNLLAYSLLMTLREPLPEILKSRIMDPIGATSTWEWHGYRNSDVNVGLETINSVSGGGHWGGGMWINTWDLARFGYLFLRNGKWKDQQLISELWVSAALAPGDVEPTYGYMWWLNTNEGIWPDVPSNSFAARGGGRNLIWVYPKADLLVVVRWIDPEKTNEFLKLIVAALAPNT